jgi:hypothetical protein
VADKDRLGMVVVVKRRKRFSECYTCILCKKKYKRSWGLHTKVLRGLTSDLDDGERKHRRHFD